MREMTGKTENRGRFLAWVFLLVSLITGLGIAWFTPMGEMPDEPAHVARASGLLTGQILAAHQPGTDGAGVFIPAGIGWVNAVELWPTLNGRALPAPERARAESFGWAGAPSFFPTQMTQYFPALYIPATLGLAVGRDCGLSPLKSLYLGRIFALLSFCLLGFAALRVARYGQALIFAVLLLPMTLYLAASFNQDGQMLALFCLAAALLTHERPGPSLPWGVALVLLMLITCSKPPYGVLMLACLLPFGAGFWRRALLVALCVLPPLAWLDITIHTSLVAWGRPPYHPGPLWPGDRGVTFTTLHPADNMRVLLAHPAQILLLPARFLWFDWGDTWRAILGEFGWQCVKLEAWRYGGWVIALGAALGALMTTVPRERQLAGRLFALGLIIATFIATVLALYVTFTNAGMPMVLGINGRYFLPLPPFLLLAAPRLGGWLAPTLRLRLEWLLTLPVLVMAVLDAYGLPAFLYHIYQMPGP
jgi:hypothetical protein